MVLFQNPPAKVLLFYEKAFANRTNLLSNRTKVTDYITECGKIDVQTQKIPAILYTTKPEEFPLPRLCLFTHHGQMIFDVV